MQSNRARVAVGVAALAAIAVLFVVFSAGGDDETTAPVAEETTTAESGEGPDGERAGGAERPPERMAPFREVIVVDGGEPRDGVKRLDYERGETVRLEVRSDVDEEIHVHGYDIYEQLAAGERTRFSFPAEIDGVFEIELHGSGAEIARLTVRP
jgi:hypothetical protein